MGGIRPRKATYGGRLCKSFTWNIFIPPFSFGNRDLSILFFFMTSFFSHSVKFA